MSQLYEKATSPATLDNVFKALKHWRNHKGEYPGAGIPDDVWTSIFQLEGKEYSGTELRSLLKLSSSQYNLKKKELLQPTASLTLTSTDNLGSAIKDTVELTDFCEVVSTAVKEESIPPLTEKIKSTQQALSKLKSRDNNPSHFLDTTTLIVECIHPDGHRLKIHTTNQSLTVVMTAFYQQGVIPE